MRNLHAIVHYWTRLVPQACRELAAWQVSIEAIADPVERQIARAKLASEHQNVESAAFFALLAGPDWRSALRQVVRFQLVYELLDGLDERQHHDIRAAVGECLQGRLLAEIDAASPTLIRAVWDVAEAQARNHARDGLRKWAETYAPGLYWWEAAAAGISSLRVLAMLCSPVEHHEQIQAAYLEIDALAALLDALVDLPGDRWSGNHNWLDHYRDERETADRLSCLTEQALCSVADLPNAPIHRMLLEGLLAHNLASVHDAPLIRSRLINISPLVRLGTRILRAREVLQDRRSQMLPIGNRRSAWQDEQ